MNAPIAAFAVDVDGTLLNPAHRLTAARRAAVERLRRYGVLVVLATARYPAAVRAIQEELAWSASLSSPAKGPLSRAARALAWRW
jgi:HAD superfamily hydrolase (TIGR01484 family)